MSKLHKDVPLQGGSAKPSVASPRTGKPGTSQSTTGGRKENQPAGGTHGTKPGAH